MQSVKAYFLQTTSVKPCSVRTMYITACAFHTENARVYTFLTTSTRALYVTLGLYRNRSEDRIKGNQATFNNSQWNNLRSCVWVSVVVFGLSPFLLGGKSLVICYFFGGS